MTKRNAGSYGHRVQLCGHNYWRLIWVVDYKPTGSRVRHPRTFTQYTDDAGAARFVRRWGIEVS